MPRFRASLLLHRGHGPRHGDLVLATGARCLTLRVAWQLGHWRVSVAEPHRRRYLTYRGPLSAGRGVVNQLWSGPLDGWCSVLRKNWRLKPNHLFMMKLRQINRSGARPPTELFTSRGEMVVRPGEALTLFRS